MDDANKLQVKKQNNYLCCQIWIMWKREIAGIMLLQRLV